MAYGAGFKYLFGRGSFERPKDGYRFHFKGMKTNAAPDSLPPGKHPIAVNIRAVNDNSVETRPGTGPQVFATHALPVTDLRSYTVLGTDNLPRTLARDSDDTIWLDDSTQVGTLAAGGLGATMIPFRPSQSPDPYMYIANAADYQKFSAPDPTVVASKVGIAEPQDSCEAAQIAQQFTEVLSPGGTWNTAGTASAWSSGDRSTDIVVTALNDPVSPFKEGGIHGATPPRWSVQVSPTVQYQRGEIVYFNGSPALITIVEEVIAPLSISMTVQAIYYKSGPPGVAVVVLQGITSPGKSTPQDNQSGVILNNIDVIAQLVRGALVSIGGETTFVRSVTSGPDNQICIECFLNNVHAIGEIVIGLPTIIVNDVQNATSVIAGTPIIGDQGNVENFTVGAGVGTLTTGPAGGGPTGTIIANATSSLNGWGPNAHVGAYEMGINQNFGWGLDPSTTSGYTNPNNVGDGNTTTFADATGQHTHTYYGSIWGFTAGVAQSNMVLNINSRVLANGDDGFTVTKRSAGIWYSLDNSVTWNQIYNMGPELPSPQPLSRPQQWDSVPLPANQDITQVQVMAFTDSHDDMVHYVYEINISAGAASIGVDTGAYQEDDYLHFSVLTDDPTNLIELKLQFDVADGTFLDNYYYTSVRPSDLVPVTANTVSQLGAIQSIVSQTQTNQEAQAVGLNISNPSVAGDGQWTEIWIPISELTRIGGDQTKTLANINSVQIVVNALATIRVAVSSIAFVGGGQPDVGQIGEPYRYRVRPRSSVTGAIGNPSPDMRYGVSAVRQPVQIDLPSAAYDTQIDRWDIFRFGGSITSWRFLGSVDVSHTSFEDNYFDDAAEVGEVLDFDNFEPWPSIDLPLNATATTIVGTEAEITIPSPTLALRYLPGNIVNLGGQSSYTLRKRPTLISGTTYLFEFDECTVGFNQGTISDNGQVSIYEPALARQFLPYMWGPDVNGTVFAVGDPLRPGTIYTAKPSNPDSAPDSYNQELTSPAEPLLGGEVLDGLSFVGSSERWWALYPQLNNPEQRYNPVQQPLPRGLAAPWGHATDGQQIYWWAKDGIWASREGSLTDDDLYNIFPHEGVDGVAVSYGPPVLGRTVQPPDYSRAGTFRLVYDNYYLYAIYQDSTGTYDMLVYDIRRKAWSVDVYPNPISAMYASEQQSGTLQTAGTSYSELLMADTAGLVYSQTPLANDNGTPITPTIATNEFDGGDLRAPKQWGDYFIDSLSASAAGISVQPMSLGAPVAPATTIPNGAGRQQTPLSVSGVVVSQFMGLFLTWTDDFSVQVNPTRLHIWDISFQVQPARTIAWTTFGTSFGMEGYCHIREVVLAFVSTADITLTITSYDGQSPLPITIPSSAGQYQKVLFPVSANKGQLYRFQMTCTESFQIFNEDCEIRCGGWSRQTPYSHMKSFSGDVVSPAPL
jgi:hypothetical protein